MAAARCVTTGYGAFLRAALHHAARARAARRRLLNRPRCWLGAARPHSLAAQSRTQEIYPAEPTQTELNFVGAALRAWPVNTAHRAHSPPASHNTVHTAHATQHTHLPSRPAAASAAHAEGQVRSTHLAWLRATVGPGSQFGSRRTQPSWDGTHRAQQ